MAFEEVREGRRLADARELSDRPAIVKIMSPSTISFTLSVTLGGDSFYASGQPNLVQKAFEDFKALVAMGAAGR